MVQERAQGAEARRRELNQVRRTLRSQGPWSTRMPFVSEVQKSEGALASPLHVNDVAGSAFSDFGERGSAMKATDRPGSDAPLATDSIDATLTKAGMGRRGERSGCHDP